jgi:uncharacterized protein YndB with AHSA1/START domain
MKPYYLFRFIVLLVFLLVADNLFAQTDYSINWPEKYQPSKSSFFVHNEIYINAPSGVVWQLLLDAERWPQWYVGAKNVKYIDSSTKRLADGIVFNWNTMGFGFTSTIKEFVPERSLCWESVKRNIKGYHAWLIIPTDSGCRVITDETQNGWLTFFEKTFQPAKLKRLHDVWLKSLKEQSEHAHKKSLSAK